MSYLDTCLVHSLKWTPLLMKFFLKTPQLEDWFDWWYANRWFRNEYSIKWWWWWWKKMNIICGCSWFGIVLDISSEANYINPLNHWKMCHVWYQETVCAQDPFFTWWENGSIIGTCNIPSMVYPFGLKHLHIHGPYLHKLQTQGPRALAHLAMDHKRGRWN